jgi:capsular exopolysaccharide synthesis family protein
MDAPRLPGYGTPIPAANLPLRAADEAAAPTVWESPSLVRFAPRSKVVVAQNPTSLAAEQYRVLRTNIIKLSQTQALKVILITSPGPGDGKTLTTMNLALSFCQKPDTRVLLIEADLRKPSVGALVAMDPGPGLADYLAGEASLEHVVRPTSIPNFHLLDSGKHSSTPADLLHSPRLGSMMEVLRSHFNWIVLDGPPTNPVADYELLTPICDGVVLVVRPFYTQRDLLRLTTEALRGRKVLGCVVNGSKHFDRYGSAYGYGYGYGPGNYAEPSAPQKKRMRKKKSSTFGGYAG